MKKLLLVLLLLTGCAIPQKHVSAPSTVSTQGSINRAKTSNQNAQRYNDVAGNDARLIDAKASVVKKYWDQSR